jgi:alpha-mannosidase
MRISLLRAPTEPDPAADAGRHEFAYAVMPHAGGWREAGVVGEAARFETPLRWAPGVAEPRSYFSVDDPNLVLDTVKRAEDSDGLVVRSTKRTVGPGTGRLRVGCRYGGRLVQPAGGSGRAARDGRRRDHRPVRTPRDRERAGG